MRGQTNRDVLDAHLQRRLRQRPTDAERKLWAHLRGRQVLNCKFRRQHPYEAYVLDFVCIERQLVIEVDGSQHLDSASDAMRDRFLADAGLGLLTRVAPALNAFALGFPLKIFLTLMLGGVVFVALPRIVSSLAGQAVTALTGVG